MLCAFTLCISDFDHINTHIDETCSMYLLCVYLTLTRMMTRLRRCVRIWMMIGRSQNSSLNLMTNYSSVMWFVHFISRTIIWYYIRKGGGGGFWKNNICDSVSKILPSFNKYLLVALNLEFIASILFVNLTKFKINVPRYSLKYGCYLVTSNVAWYDLQIWPSSINLSGMT